MINFKEELKQYQQKINNELEKYTRKQKCPEEILNNSMEYSLMAGGKRLRPILLLATYKLFEQNESKCMPYAVAIEMIHNFSLIDNDDFRHGKPTNHKQYNEATAILAGDGLLNYAYMIISDDINKTVEAKEQSNKIKIFQEYTQAVDRMIAGEYIDTEAEGKQITEQELKYIHENKTGAMLKVSVRAGATTIESPV